MTAAHTAYYRDKNRMDDLRLSIDVFVENPPARCHRSTVEFLRAAAGGLKSDSDHVVSVWN